MRGLILLLILLGLGCGTDPGAVNAPPTLELDVSGEVSYELGDIIRITMSGEDPEQGPVTFSVENLPDRALVQSSGSFAVMTWDPVASDVTPDGQPLSAVFVATDEFGARTERVVRINIRSGSGAPRFTNSNSVLHNAGSGPVVFDVTIRDDDSSGVSIAMPSGFAPAGAELTSTGPFSARFGWQPSAEQLERRVHTVRFIANDSQNDPVEQTVSIILKKETQNTTEPRELDATCRFESAVEYQSLAAQFGASDYAIKASITASGREAGYDRLVLNWTTEDVWNDWSLPWQSSEMMPAGEDFVGVIPNPVLTEGSQEIYYEICAINDDAEEGDQSAYLCGPTSLFDSFIVYPPGTDACNSFAPFNTTIDLARNLGGDWELERICAGETLFYEITLGTGQESTLYLVYPLSAAPTVQVYDVNRTLLPAPTPATCGGFTDIFLTNPGASTKFYIEIQANENAANIPFQIVAETRDMMNPTECLDAQYEPNDSLMTATPITTASASFTGLEICRSDDLDVYSFQADAGELINVDLAFSHEIGDIDLKLFRPSQTSIGKIAPSAAWSVGVSDEESIEYVTTEAGLHHILVYSNRPNRYSMTFERSDASGVCVDTDGGGIGTNDTQGDAEFIADGLSEGLKVCGAAEDWFSFPVIDYNTETFEIEVAATEGALSDLTVEVWDTFGRLGTAVESGGTLKFTLFPLNNEEHYIRVLSGGAVTYSLELTVLFGI